MFSTQSRQPEATSRIGTQGNKPSLLACASHGEDDLAAFRQRLADRGVALMLDFVPFGKQ